MSIPIPDKVGFGRLPSPRPNFSQGISVSGSFAPIWTTSPITSGNAGLMQDQAQTQTISVCVNGSPGTMVVVGEDPIPDA